MNSKDKAKMTAIEIIDTLAELDFSLEKADVLSSEVLNDYLEKITFDTEKGRLTAKYDLNIAKVKEEVVCNYIAKSVESIEKLKELSENILKILQESSRKRIKTNFAFKSYNTTVK